MLRRQLFTMALGTLFSTTAFSQRYNPPGEGRIFNYSCQLAERLCGYQGDSREISLIARNDYEARLQCENAAYASRMILCGVELVSPHYDRYQTDFRCQTATKFCGYNGGRYGTWIQAFGRAEAVRKCEQIAHYRGEVFCQVE
jgi:hypothetical protein